MASAGYYGQPPLSAADHYPMDNWTCAHCGEVIGVYEPMIVVVGEDERRTSRLNEPQFDEPQDIRFHEKCRDRTRGL